MIKGLCIRCGAAPCEPQIWECLECWAAVPAHTELAMEKIRAGVPFREAKRQALREKFTSAAASHRVAA